MTDYEKKYAKRLKEIDDRIEHLSSHMTMWSRAGGRGGAMAMQALGEINELKREKERILNGTQAKIDELEQQIEILKSIKRRISKLNIFKQMEYSKEIKEQEQQILNLKAK